MRNSESTVVQFVYGDDSLHPEKMENNDRPVDFDRLRVHISQTRPCPDETALRPQELRNAVESHLESSRFQSILPTGGPFLEEIRNYYNEMAKKQEELMEIDGIDEYDVDRITWNSCRITKTQLELALEKALTAYSTSFVEPGEAVGAMGAQSISEPGTQMTLKVSAMGSRKNSGFSVVALIDTCSFCFCSSDIPLRRCLLDERYAWRTAFEGDYQRVKGHFDSNHYSEIGTRRQ